MRKLLLAGMALMVGMGCGDSESAGGDRIVGGTGITNTDSFEQFKGKAFDLAKMIDNSRSLSLTSSQRPRVGFTSEEENEVTTSETQDSETEETSLSLVEQEYDCDEGFYEQPEIESQSEEEAPLQLSDSMNCEQAIKSVRSVFNNAVSNLKKQVQQVAQIKEGKFCGMTVKTIVDPASAYAVQIAGEEDGNSLNISLRGGSNEDKVALRTTLDIELSSLDDLADDDSYESDYDMEYDFQSDDIDEEDYSTTQGSQQSTGSGKVTGDIESIGYLNQGRLDMNGKMDASMAGSVQGTTFSFNMGMNSKVEVVGINVEDNLRVSESSTVRVDINVDGQEPQKVDYTSSVNMEEISNGLNVTGQLAIQGQKVAFDFDIKPDPEGNGYCAIELNNSSSESL